MMGSIQDSLKKASLELTQPVDLWHPRTYFYEEFSIKTGNRKKPRFISAPSHELRELQRFLLAIGIRDIPTHYASTAYRKGNSIVANARKHAARPYLFKTDIVDFFPSISTAGLGDVLFDAFPMLSPEMIPDLLQVLSLEGNLAQGAPTSPQLSNVFMRDFDALMAVAAESGGARYTRYADDISISAFNRDNILGLAETARAEISKLGLAVNESKTRLLGPNDRKIVTGLDVTNFEIRPTRKFRKKTQAMLRAYLKYGKSKLVLPVKGRFAFWNGVAPHDPLLRSLRASFFEKVDLKPTVLNMP